MSEVRPHAHPLRRSTTGFRLHTIARAHLFSSLFLLPLCLCVFATTLVSCSDDDDDEIYPSLITEMSVAYSDANGTMTRFTTDSGHSFLVSNKVSGMNESSALRALLSYVDDGDAKARVYQARQVPVLSRFTGSTPPERDATGVLSGWIGGGYLNFHLLPMTKGGKQGWAYLCDSTTTNGSGGTTHHLSLVHDQLDDEAAYSSDFYISINLDSIASAFLSTDSIAFTIYEDNGPQVWNFGNLK